MSYILTAVIFYVLGVCTGLLIYRKHQAKLTETEAKAKTAIDALRK